MACSSRPHWKEEQPSPATLCLFWTRPSRNNLFYDRHWWVLIIAASNVCVFALLLVFLPRQWCGTSLTRWKIHLWFCLVLMFSPSLERLRTPWGPLLVLCFTDVAFAVYMFYDIATFYFMLSKSMPLHLHEDVAETRVMLCLLFMCQKRQRALR